MNVKIDATKLTLGDVEVLMDTAGEHFTMTDKVNVLKRICPDTDVRAIPVIQLPELMTLVNKELDALMSPSSTASVSLPG